MRVRQPARFPARNHSDLWELVSGHTTDGRATFAADEVKALALSVARRIDDLVACGWPVPTIVHEVCRDHATSSNPVSVARWRLTQIPTGSTPPPVDSTPDGGHNDLSRLLARARRYRRVLLSVNDLSDITIREMVADKFGDEVAAAVCPGVVVDLDVAREVLR